MPMGKTGSYPRAQTVFTHPAITTCSLQWRLSKNSAPFLRFPTSFRDALSYYGAFCWTPQKLYFVNHFLKLRTTLLVENVSYYWARGKEILFKNTRVCERSVSLRIFFFPFTEFLLQIVEWWPLVDFSVGTQQCVVQKASASWRLEFWQKKKRHFYR